MKSFKGLMSVGLIGVLSLGISTGVKAQELTQTVSATLKSDGIHMETPSVIDFKDVVIVEGKKTHKTGFGDNVKVLDLRGTSDGWHVKVKATPMSNETDTLPVGSLTLDGVKSLNGTGVVTNNEPSISLNKTTVIDDGEVLVANATEGKGTGEIGLVFDEDSLGLTVDPKTAKVGTYQSTITWTLEATPYTE